MKNLIILLIAIFCFQFTNGQEFRTTDKYTIISKKQTKQQEYETSLIDVVTTGENSITIATLNISDINFLEDVAINVLTNPHIEGIQEVIKVDVAYNTCCAETETYYFMVTNTNEFTSLPYIENVYCEGAISETEYIFPIQKLGEENMILKATVNFTETYKVKDIEVLQSFALNDDEFLNDEIDYSEVLTN